MITIYDIAKRSGYSITTVSKALNGYSDISEKTRRKIQKLAEEMGYRPNSAARSLSMKRSWMIGVFFQDHVNSGLLHPFFIEVIESFKKEVGKKGYDLLFFANQLGEKEISYVDHSQHRNVDGVIILGLSRNDPFLSELVQSEIPCVSVDLDLVGKQVGYITSDNIEGAFQAMEYLYSLGHRKIAHISGILETLAGQQRYIGYQRAIEKLGLVYRSDYIVDVNYTVEGGEEAMKKLLSLHEPPTAVFAAGDLMAIGAIKAAKEAGLHIPEDLSVVGFDNISFSQYISPPLTTVHQQKDLLGKMAAEALLNLIEEKDTIPSILTIKTQLMIRESCAPPAKP